ncbi:MAG: hypothetical protein AB1632_14800 [Nitrospirota bacterium]
MMKNSFIIVLIGCFLTACATKTYQPVASIEGLASKTELEQRKNWVTNSDTKSGAAFTAGFAGGLLIGLPIALVIASIPDEKGITIDNISDRVAAKTYDLETKRLVTYWDSATSWEYAVTGITNEQKADDSAMKPVVLLFLRDKGDDKKAYCEVRLVSKDDDNRFLNWRFQILKVNAQGELVYALNENLKVKEPILIRRDIDDRWIHLTFTDLTSAGNTVIKSEDDFFSDVRDHFLKNSCTMEIMRCPNGDKDCGKKGKESISGSGIE